MSVQLFLTLLLFFSTLSSLITEAIKKQFEAPVPNLIVLCVSCVVGLVGTFIYYCSNGISVGLVDCIYAILMGVATWLCSMLGYDKVKQTLSQLVG